MTNSQTTERRRRPVIHREELRPTRYASAALLLYADAIALPLNPKMPVRNETHRHFSEEYQYE